ncbi:hypothetical protein PIB30_113722, partial [Stylosanthes scabra]|nr:hypothetical protein [Stylosanthes scabra]
QATTHDPCRSRSCVAPNFTRPTHRRGSPRICVGSQDHHASTRNLKYMHGKRTTQLARPKWRPTHRRGSPRLGVEDKAKLLKIPESTRYTWLLTHNVTQEAKVPESPRYT